MKLPGSDSYHICHAKVLYIVADLPAKAAVKYCSQYNAKYGCTECEIPGRSVATGKGHAMVFGKKPEEPALRTHHTVTLNAEAALIKEP